MMTVRHIERLWKDQRFDRLIDELVTGRAEGVAGIRPLLQGPLAAAALAVIRMGELHQAHQPLAARLVRFLLASQELDGRFGDTATSALTLRALAASQGAGPAIASALKFLETLQRDDGEWPAEPLRRMPGDPAVTAFVIRQIAECRTPAATQLVDRALQRLLEDPAAGDHQLATLRQRVLVRKPSTARSWS